MDEFEYDDIEEYMAPQYYAPGMCVFFEEEGGLIEYEVNEGGELVEISNAR